jgi:acyl dehydratase
MDSMSPESEIKLGVWTASEESVRQYLKAVGDTRLEYFESNLVPPLSLAAYALGALLEKLALPSGAVHSLQEVETLGPVKLGEEISGVARLERPRRRGGLQFTTATYTLQKANGQQVQTGKSTVLVRASDSP